MYSLRNETPSEQIRNTLDELTCRLAPEAGDYQDHVAVDESTEASHSSNRGYPEDHGYEDDGRRGQLDAATSEPSNVKHLFDIPQEQLPCPESLHSEPDPTFPFQFNPKFGQGGESNAGIQTHVVSAMIIFNFVVMLVT
jgi:hypothetical protein